MEKNRINIHRPRYRPEHARSLKVSYFMLFEVVFILFFSPDDGLTDGRTVVDYNIARRTFTRIRDLSERALKPPSIRFIRRLIAF